MGGEGHGHLWNQVNPGDGEYTDIDAIDIGATDMDIFHLLKPGKSGWYWLYKYTDIDLGNFHLGNEVNPGDAQASDHAQHHNKAPAYQTIPCGQRSCWLLIYR